MDFKILELENDYLNFSTQKKRYFKDSKCLIGHECFGNVDSTFSSDSIVAKIELFEHFVLFDCLKERLGSILTQTVPTDEEFLNTNIRL